MTGGTGNTTNHAAAPDFAALFRELGLDATCSPAELRTAWRRRVSKLHPDLGGSAEDTGRLQELNRLYDAAVDFHARFGRMPGAPAPGARPAPLHDEAGSTAAGQATIAAWRRADAASAPPGAAGFGRISRSFVATALVAVAAIAVAVLGWRLAWRGHETIPTEGSADAAATEAAPSGARFEAAFDASPRMPQADVQGRDDVRTGMRPEVARSLETGMDRNTVRDILGEPLDMQALRWEYGPSWVDFDCDRVVDWYSSPLRPLPVADARAPQATPHDAADRGCH